MKKRSYLFRLFFGVVLTGLLFFGIACGANDVCPQGGCDQTCSGSCNRTCAGGSCTQYCPSGASCNFTCAGGKCKQTCEKGASSCSFTCAPGDCEVKGVGGDLPSFP